MGGSSRTRNRTLERTRWAADWRATATRADCMLRQAAGRGTLRLPVRVSGAERSPLSASGQPGLHRSAPSCSPSGRGGAAIGRRRLPRVPALHGARVDKGWHTRLKLLGKEESQETEVLPQRGYMQLMCFGQAGSGRRQVPGQFPPALHPISAQCGFCPGRRWRSAVPCRCSGAVTVARTTAALQESVRKEQHRRSVRHLHVCMAAKKPAPNTGC